VIARVLGISKNTVKAALGADGPPNYERAQRASIVDEVEPRIRELLQAYPRPPATVIVPLAAAALVQLVSAEPSFA